jgi:hypothetical protein
MNTLIKIHSSDCAICQTIGDQAKSVADEYELGYEVVELTVLAATTSPLRDYVVSMYVEPNDGEIELPIFLVSTSEGYIQASGVVTNLEEVKNLVNSWKLWDTSKK